MITVSKPQITREEITAVTKVLKSGMIANGPKVKELEEKFAQLCQAKYAIATTNGTSALHTACHAIGLKEGDEVITVAFTFVATANAILMTGATPVFADIEDKTFNINPANIEKLITKKTKAIMVVNLYGQPADYEEIKKIARNHNLIIIEDAAQSVGATYKKQVSGTIGDIACFSFYATKNVMCGEGGMVTTNNKDYAERARYFINHGQPPGVRYTYKGLGYNYRLTDVLGVIALVQLKYVNKLTAIRIKNAARYTKAFAGIKGLITPIVGPNRTHVYHQYTVRVTKDFPMSRDELKEHLLKKGIQTMIYYPTPISEFDHLKQFVSKKDALPETQQIYKEVLSLPVHPLLKEKEIKHIIKTIQAI